MTDTPQKTDTEKQKAEAERLAALEREKQERLAKAEADKQERIRIAKEKRAKELAEEEAEQKAKAAALLPDDKSLNQARQKIKARIRAAKRRLAAQILIFAIAPTVAVATYQSLYAVPLYEARSVVSITKANTQVRAGIGGLLGSIGGAANMREVFMADEYIKSQTLMDQLEDKLGLISEFSSDKLDEFTRLRAVDLLRISKRDQFSRFLKSTVNIQTGLLTLYVRAPSIEQAITVSNTALDLTSRHINSLSETLYLRRTELARRAVNEARQALTQAQTNLTQLQINSGELNPKVTIEGIYATIAQLESEALKLETQLQQAILAGQSDAYQTQRIAKLKEGINDRIKAQRQRLVKSPENGGKSLNALLMDFDLATLQIKIAQETLAATLQALTKASADAALGQIHFQIVVPPKSAQNPKTPNILGSALITLLITIATLSVAKMLVPMKKL